MKIECCECGKIVELIEHETPNGDVFYSAPQGWGRAEDDFTGIFDDICPKCKNKKARNHEQIQGSS